MKRKEEIINHIKMFIPIILLSVSSYVLLYFMLSKDRYIIQSILCAFYYLYLIYLYKRINSCKQLYWLNLYIIVMLIVSVMGVVPLPSKLPVNMFYNILAVILDCAITVVYAPITYLCARSPAYIYLVTSSILYIFVWLYSMKYMLLKGERKKYHILFLVIFITLIEIQIACLNSIYLVNYNHTFFMVFTWLLWIYCIYHFRQDDKFLSVMSKIWMFLFWAQALSSAIIFTIQWMPLSVQRFVYQTGINHLFYYVYLPFLYTGLPTAIITYPSQMVSLFLIFILWMASKIWKQKRPNNMHS